MSVKSFVIGPENLHHFPNQSDPELNQNVTFYLPGSMPQEVYLLAFALTSDWLLLLSSFILIGSSRSFPMFLLAVLLTMTLVLIQQNSTDKNFNLYGRLHI